jgi:molybdenum-dependent DNA-binding transcriptional regulator ModE
MELHQVRYFLALCEEKSFTRAAKHCGVSQPSLSNAIGRLEQELGGRLFHRNRVNCRLSELGQEMWPHFAKLDQCARDARRQAARFLTAPRTSAAALKQAPSINSPEQQERGIASRMPLAPALEHSQPKGALMRAHLVIAVVAVILVGIGVKLIFFSVPTAEADSLSIKSVGVDVSQLHQNVRNLPVEKSHDMSFVFSGGD